MKNFIAGVLFSLFAAISLTATVCFWIGVVPEAMVVSVIVFPLLGTSFGAIIARYDLPERFGQGYFAGVGVILLVSAAFFLV